MNRIKDLRTDKKLSQNQLAKELNVAQNTISQWERGIRDLDGETLTKLASYFDVSIDYLLGVDNSTMKRKGFDMQAMMEENANTDKVRRNHIKELLEFGQKHGLTDDEREFIEILRKADDKDKDMLKGIARRMVELGGHADIDLGASTKPDGFAVNKAKQKDGE